MLLLINFIKISFLLKTFPNLMIESLINVRLEYLADTYVISEFFEKKVLVKGK